MIKTLLVVLGPTGVGKTEVCMSIARNYGISVINADSRQVYSEIPIGTAAPTAKQMSEVKHYFVGSRHVTDNYNANMYERDVMSLLEGSDAPLALLSGGSMMYVDAVCYGIDDIPDVSEDVRLMLKKRLASEGLAPLVEELWHLDPQYAKEADLVNPRRVIHALEICISSGLPYSSFRKKSRIVRPFRILKTGLTLPREQLYDRINNRVDVMLNSGMIDEAKRVYQYRNLNALNTVGFKELFEYLDGLTTLDEASFKIKSATRRYARKQQTWFKRDKDIHWFSPENIEEILNYISENAN